MYLSSVWRIASYIYILIEASYAHATTCKSLGLFNKPNMGVVGGFCFPHTNNLIPPLNVLWRINISIINPKSCSPYENSEESRNPLLKLKII